MEDQQSDSGDLTDSAALPDVLVPEGKSGRRKHRVARSKLRQPGEETAGPAEEPVVEEPVEDAVVAEPEVAAPADPDAAGEQPEPDPDPGPAPKPRRRFGWRRGKTAAISEEAIDAEVQDVSATANAEVETEADADAEPEAETELEPEPEPEPEPILVPHRTAPKGLKIAAAVAAALMVTAAGYASAMFQPYLSERADVQIKQEVAETAAAAITTLWTYTPGDIDQLGDRTARYLGGDFASQYRDFIDSIAEANKQAQVTNQTQVVGAAVESLTPTEATAIVYTNSVSTTPNSQGFQSMRYLSYRLTMENRDRKWLITKMNDITSLDLTPQI